MGGRVVLAYSGGLDTSVAIPWLGDQGWEVVAVAVDVGQPGELGADVARASELGAVEARLVDAQTEFAEGFVLPALAMNALYQGRYPLVSALSRPLIAKHLAAIARETGADAIAHGCTGKGNDQIRFEAALAVLAPDARVLAPVRDWDLTRDDAIEYAQQRALPIKTTRSSPYSTDDNLWGRSIECGVLEDPWHPVPEDAFAITCTSDATHEIELGFEQGVPVAVDGERLTPVEILNVVTKVAGTYGVGRIDMVEDRLIGIKSREVYEAPAAMTLIPAHQELEALTLERSVAREKRKLEQTWADLVYEGLWFSPLRTALDAFARVTQQVVTGEVRVRLGTTAQVTARRSQVALYDTALATYGEGATFREEDAAGFSRIWSLPSKRFAKVHGV